MEPQVKPAENMQDTCRSADDMASMEPQVKPAENDRIPRRCGVDLGASMEPQVKPAENNPPIDLSALPRLLQWSRK